MRFDQDLDGLVWDGRQEIPEVKSWPFRISMEEMTLAEASRCWQEQGMMLAPAHVVYNMLKSVAGEISRSETVPWELDKALAAGIITDTAVEYSESSKIAVVRHGYSLGTHYEVVMPFRPCSPNRNGVNNLKLLKEILLTNDSRGSIENTLNMVSKCKKTIFYLSIFSENRMKPVSIGYSSIENAVYFGTNLSSLNGKGCSIGVDKNGL